jgi:hypothetical protein
MTYHGGNPSDFVCDRALANHGRVRRVETMRLKTQASMILVLFLMAGSAGAQFEYTAPGGPEEKPASRKQAFELEVSRARYQLGPVHVAPWASLHDVAYVRALINTGQQLPSDFTATGGAGFRAYLRNGPKVTWSAEVLPEYVWWEKEVDRRRFDGRYQLGFHAFFNRLTVEATAGRSQQLQLVTPEVPVLTSSRQDGGEITTELELTHTFYLFAAGSFTDHTYLASEATDPAVTSLHLLDRQERLIQGGLRWQPYEDLWLALGVEGSRVDFARAALPRSNSGTSPLARFHYRSRLLGVDGELAFRSLSARQESDFVSYHKTTGSVALTIGDSRHLLGSIYTSRSLVYSITPGYAYLQDDRLGVSLRESLGRRFSVRIFAETGSDDFTAFTAGTPHRHDDVVSFGGGVDFDLGREVILGFNALHSNFAPSTSGPSRTYSSAGLTLSFGGR